MKYRLFILFLMLLFKSAFAQYALEDVFPSLPLFSNPTDMLLIPDGSNRMLVLEQRGRLWIFNPQSPSKTRLFWDGRGIVSPNGCEDGLLGCAFDPNFAINHYVYLNYTTGSDPQWFSHIIRYECSTAKPDTIIPSSAYEILTITQPAGRCNHKGGCLQFGNDGYLYASFGDGGSGGDPDKNGQNKSVLFGKILRLDVDHETDGKHYAIPANNPFAGNTQGFKEEIYSYGMRNTWKFSFDRPIGTLWAGDVGQDAYEEIDTIINGGNYGWNIMEGFHCYPSGLFECDSTGLIPPIWEYPHNGNSVAITGGFIYHGNSMPVLAEKYIYGDYVMGKIWALTYGNSRPVMNQLLIDKASPVIAISSFAEDQANEIYVLGYNTGKIYKLISNAAVRNISSGKDFSLSADRTLLDDLHQSANIHFILPQSEHITLSLIGEAGQEIQRLVDLNMDGGEHTYQLNLRPFANGMYFVRLIGSSGTLVQKISVMK
jgi:glucose/arabinose dehydrogenase